jgi:hypothetical protein
MSEVRVERVGRRVVFPDAHTRKDWDVRDIWLREHLPYFFSLRRDYESVHLRILEDESVGRYYLAEHVITATLRFELEDDAVHFRLAHEDLLYNGTLPVL